MLAAMLPDLLLGPFMLLGVEPMRIVPGITALVPFDLYGYPWSHSLVMTLGWASMVSAICRRAKRSGSTFATTRRVGSTRGVFAIAIPR
jgi:hypothetical protein